ncbi:isoleucine--tRNA ligase [Candidatus Pacearchaeota archaeon]|nr:isoleucine--tRNA ligase [Candidatus Pacearchaeota archaeon]|tara:strand:- start:12042 stop:14849 length:2808 start_codon:yes stop_codon:yes gene_type:complete
MNMLDFKEIEEEILGFWEKKKIYEKVKEKNSKGTKFYFLQGPPYTSGKLHIGHAWNNSLKDIILRYKRMNGFNVWDRGGYDMHGLPTENAVQKKLGLKTKEDIEKSGIDKFVKECLNFSVEHAGYMNEDLWKLGVWMDHENAYMPVKKEFIDGEWAFFKEADEQNRLYKGEKVMHWDAETETSLAKHELEYETIKDDSIFLKFKVKRKNEYFIVWTTTPWTIPYNLAIMANPDLDYVKVDVEGEKWILAKALVGAFVSGVLDKKYEIIEEFKGKELEGIEYEHFLKDELKEQYGELKKKSKNVHTVILSKDFVDTSAGSGLVHSAPGCGQEDQEACVPYKIEPFNTLNEQGIFEGMGKYDGMKAKVDDGKFIEEFDKKGSLVVKTKVEHEYPHSWRSHKPVVFRTTEQWFLRITDMVDKLIKFNKEAHWEPKVSGKNYDKWAENLRDNGVTRQRFWGCPVPIWVNVEDPEDYIVIGSVEELEKLTGQRFDDLRLHKPWIDSVEIKRGDNKYKRIPDVADVWIDSGTASWNCLHNDPKLIKEWFPADLVLEATEQTRLWFSLLQICSGIMFNKGSYENVYVHGMILDYQGTKMSKSLGNIISPYEVLDKYSADILRYYICQTGAGENINFSWEDVKVKQRNLIMLGNIGNYILDLERQKLKKGKLEVEDKWIISKFNTALKEVTELFESYRLDEVIGKIEELFVILSRDYIKYVRDRDEKVVLDVIKEVYLGVLKMFSTVCPFMMDYLWKQMEQGEESVHLADWPSFSEKKVDKKLEEEFDNAMKVIEVGLMERNNGGIGLRWPLAKADVVGAELSKGLKEIVGRQLNVKKVECKKGKQIGVKLNTKMNKELEAEGFSREIARKVQAARKKAGLKKGDLINLKLGVDDGLKKMLGPWTDFLKERTNSEKIEFVDGKIEKKENLFTVREKQIAFEFS